PAGGCRAGNPRDYSGADRPCNESSGTAGREGPAGGRSAAGGQGQQSDFGAHVVAERGAEADALVDVQVAVGDAVHAGGDPLAVAPEGDAPQSGQVDLAAVGVAAQHEIAAAAAKLLDGAGVVGQDQAGPVGGRGVRPGDVTLAAPQVLQPGQVQGPVAA